MNTIRRSGQWWRGLLLLAGSMLCADGSPVVMPSGQLAFKSIAVSGSNLVFNAAIPAGVDQATLEMRPSLDTSWRDAARMTVPADGGLFEFVIPKPALELAFFRLRAVTLATTNSQLSAELQYVAMPPLGPDPTNALVKDPVLHFKGVVDGSDRILITRAGAFWEHVNWGWPAGSVTVNGTSWNPREKNYLTSTGAVAFLPDAYSLDAAYLERIQGRDVVTLERTNAALVVYLDDTPSGAATYEFKIHFHPASARPGAATQSPTATLKVAARIDGSDTLKITAQEATWEHGAYSYPRAISLNGIPWDVRWTNPLVNSGTNTFLPDDVDFSTARITHRKGRDLSTMWADDATLWIHFADNPNGADAYELELSFGR